MTRGIFLLLCVCLSACVHWRSKDPTEIRAAKQPHVFVIAAGQAHEMRLTSVSNGTLVGNPLRSWRIPQDRFTVKDGEDPNDIVERLKWKVQPASPSVMLRFTDIQHLQVRKVSVASGVGTFVVYASMIGLVVLIGASPGK
jgi:hypothetical protein